MDNLIEFEENKLMRYCNSKIDKTTFETGKRFNNLIQVKMVSDEEFDTNDDFKFYKIIIVGNCECVNIKKDMGYNGETCKYEMNYYLLNADCKHNKLWDEEDDIYYHNWKINNYEDDNDECKTIIIDEWFDYLQERFKNAKFVISMDKNELKEILTAEKTIVIKQEFNCYCFNGVCECCNEALIRPKTRYFVIKNDIMSVENVIDELIKQDCKTYCNHNFLEFFDKQTDVQFGMFFGS